MSLSYDAPDIAKGKSLAKLPIDLVGIQGLQIPIQLSSRFTSPSRLSVFVSLDKSEIKGIHMSRMYLAIDKHFSNKIFKISDLKKLLKNIVKDQKGLSSSSRVEIHLDWPVKRKALKSSIWGWRVYPCFIQANYFEKKKNFEFIIGASVSYSSTCPCSASLSREIIKKEFFRKFPKKLQREKVMEWFESKESLVATPHAQKSFIDFKFKIKEEKVSQFSVLKCIDKIEKILGTPVQTAVKREDEAEFAKLNAKNLMFCEDAVRKVAHYFKNEKAILDYKLKVNHNESLHPFAVESHIVKGLKNGWRA
ncbi:MAG: GTP cyclohydrolase FolE2 [Bdellovibrionales bacterium]